MTLATRMRAVVGDVDTVARYLLEKMGHTALVFLALFFWAHLLVAQAAFTAALVYDVCGKVIWWSAHPGDRLDAWTELRDLVYDLWVGLGVLALVLVPESFGLTLIAWAFVFLILDNNRWGRPS